MSTEYIERGAALARSITVKHYDGVLGGVCDHEYVRTKDIKAIPAADVEPVVRCGRCKYAEIGADGFIETCEYWNGEFDTFHLTTMHPDGYCSNGIEKIVPHMDERSEHED